MNRGDLGGRRRYQLTQAAGRFLWKPGVGFKEQHRTVGCGRHIQDSTHGVEILRRKDGSGARFRGVTTCGSIWACPACAHKIAPTRANELRLANGAHAKAGGAAYLITLTFPHTAGTDLVWLRDTFTKALQRWRNSRKYRRYFGEKDNPGGEWGRVGDVKGLEITYGKHGWHPHVHLVLFAKAGLQDDVEGIGHMRDQWIHCVIKTGLAPQEKMNDMLLHAFDFQEGEFVAQYIAKMGREPEPSSRELDALKSRWGLHSEATMFLEKNNTAHGDYIGLTPFGLLADAHENGDTESRRLYREFVDAFDGKRQLVWSPGLKKTLGIAELEDEEIARGERKKPEEEFCIRLFAEEWKVLQQHARHDAPHLALYVAGKFGREGVEHLLALLQGRAPPGKGGFLELYRSRLY